MSMGNVDYNVAVDEEFYYQLVTEDGIIGPLEKAPKVPPPNIKRAVVIPHSLNTNFPDCWGCQRSHNEYELVEIKTVKVAVYKERNWHRWAARKEESTNDQAKE